MTALYVVSSSFQDLKKKKSELLQIKKKRDFGDTNRVKIMRFENEPAVFCFIPPLP